MDSPLELRQEHGDDLTPEDLIDPQLFLEWQRSLDHPDRATGAAQSFTAELTGTTGERGMYRVIPIVSGGTINWLDAAGYILARSPKGDAPFHGRRVYRDDFELHTDTKVPPLLSMSPKRALSRVGADDRVLARSRRDRRMTFRSMHAVGRVCESEPWRDCGKPG